MDDTVETVRRTLIARLERHALAAQNREKRGEHQTTLDSDLFFCALADVGVFNRKHPDRVIPPLDPLSCRVKEPRFLS